MAFNADKPADTDEIRFGAGQIRENFAAVVAEIALKADKTELTELSDRVDLKVSAADIEEMLTQLENTADTIGQLAHFARMVEPKGWLWCGGQAISRTTYADLFAVIGTTFGTGDGSTTFNVPDLKGLFLRNTGGANAAYGVKQTDALQNITGSLQIRKNNASFATFQNADGVFTAVNTTDTTTGISSSSIANVGQTVITFDASRTARTSTETRPVNMAFPIYIRYMAGVDGGSGGVSAIAPTEKIQDLGYVTGQIIIDGSQGNIIKMSPMGMSLRINDIIASAQSGYCQVLTLILEGGGVTTMTWPPSITWSYGKAPTLSGMETDIITLINTDGYRWFGMLSGGGFLL